MIKRLLRKLPVTPHYRRAIREELKKSVRARLIQFPIHVPRDTPEYPSLRRAFRRHRLRISALQYVEDSLIPSLLFWFVAPATAVILFGIIRMLGLIPLFKSHTELPDEWSVTVLGGLCFVAGFACIIGPLKVAEDLPRILRPRARIVLIWPVLISLVLLAIAFGMRRNYPQDGHIRFISVCTGAPPATMLLAMISAFFFFFPLDAAMSRRKARRHPDSVAICAIFTILTRMQVNQANWLDASRRASYLWNIDHAADAISYGLPLLMRAGEPTIDQRVKRTADEIATSIRSLKLWIATPMADTYYRLRERLAADLVIMLRGHWDLLLRHDPPQTRPPKSWRAAFERILTLVIAAAPISALWGLQRTSLSLEGTVLRYATVGALAWLVISVVLVFDPMFSVKATAFRAIAQLLPFGKSGKD